MSDLLIPSLFEGNLIKLTALDPEKDADILANWTRDPEFLHLYQLEPARPLSKSQVKQKIEADEKSDNNRFLFAIRRVIDDRMVGTALLKWIEYSNGIAWLELGIGELSDRGKGYGREALRLILGYAFDELNLHSLMIMLPEYNQSGRLLLESEGFCVEVNQRKALLRNGQRFDLLVMGLLAKTWREKTTERPTFK
jgi:RimJ/RimL family protein N-acetyltransferase